MTLLEQLRSEIQHRSAAEPRAGGLFQAIADKARRGRVRAGRRRLFLPEILACGCLLAGAPAAGQVDHLPSADPDDGRFLLVAGQPVTGNQSAAVLELTLTVPSSATSFEIGIFDGDSGEIVGDSGRPDFGESRWDIGAPAAFEYALFDNSGNPVTLHPDFPLGPVPSGAMPNDDWCCDSASPFGAPGNFTVPAASGSFRLEIRHLAFLTATANALKLRTLGAVIELPPDQPFTLIANVNSKSDVDTVFPFFCSDPADATSTYDGTWDLLVDFDPREGGDLILRDGDFDRGSFDGDRACSPQPLCLLQGAQDTDDPSTADDGVAEGAGGTTGDPPDDRDPASDLTIGSCTLSGDLLRRQPAIRYDVIFPNGRIYSNENPSGNQEWETFLVSAATGCDPSPACVPDSGRLCADACVSPGSLPGGLYQLRIDGVDMLNPITLRLPGGEPHVGDLFLNVGDTVFLDLDGDGSQQAGEPGIPRVLVNLLDSDGNFQAQTVTSSAGKYVFRVSGSIYTVQIAPENFALGTAGRTLGGRSWLDVDGNGVRDAGEPGLAGVGVRLFAIGPDAAVSSADDVLVAETDTDPAGRFAFHDLSAATYFVDIEDGSVPTALALSAGSDPSATRAITSNEIFLDLDFGYANADAATGLVSGRVWSDADGDGLRDPGEEGIGDVTLDLVDAGGAVVGEASTAPDGSYLFTGVAPGTYTLDVVDRFGLLRRSSRTDGLESSPDPSAPFPVAAGGTARAADFGYQTDANRSVVETVFFDADGDGNQDAGESGFGGATAKLFDSAGRVVAATTSQSGTGALSFSGLPPGPYSLQITDLDGALLGLHGTTPQAREGSRQVAIACARVRSGDGGVFGEGCLDVTAQGFGYTGSLTLAGHVGTTLKAPVDDFDRQTETIVFGSGTYDFGYVPSELAITKLDTPDPVAPGAELAYTIEVSNAGPPRTGVTVTDELPSEVTFSSAAGSGWSCDEAAGIVTCTRPVLAFGLAPVITITVTAPAALGSYRNDVSLTTAEDAITLRAAALTEVRLAELSISQSDSPDPVDSGATLTYTLVAANAGPEAATSVEVVDTLPQGVTFSSATGDGWLCEERDLVVTCRRPEAGSGAAMPPIVIAVIAPDRGGSLTNIASVTAAEPDTDASDDTAVELTTVAELEPLWIATGATAVPRDGHTATLLPSGKVLLAGGSSDLGGEIYDPATGAWQSTGLLSVARTGHTATLLPSGRVLVAGGAGDASAELYGPATGGWQATGSLMTAVRTSHTATLLPSGEVLVAGGAGDASAELYDPASGQWRATGSLMTAVRASHTASLLPSGEVLVVGGAGDQSAEIYDPATDQWQAIGSLMTAVRASHTATLLPSGEVLVAGGSGDGSAEIYDPLTGLWQGTGPLAGPRSGHTAALLATGEVLVASGATAELYEPAVDPAAGVWTEGPSLLASHGAPTATVLPSGRVLLIGGSERPELYDRGGSWSATGPLAEPRQDHTATLLPSGEVLVAGGGLAGTELYNPADGGTWGSAAALPEARTGHTATLLPTGVVLVAGGSSGPVLASALLYDPGPPDGWTPTPETMTKARTGHTATLLPTGEVLAAGGDQDDGASAELYDPTSGAWRSTGALAVGRSGHTATLLASGKVLVTGGTRVDSGLATPGAELYDPRSGSWEPATTMAFARRLHTATLLPSGRVLAVGGEGPAAASAEVYDPATDSWELAPPPALRRERHTATLLPSGKVLVAGGFNADFGLENTSVELYHPGGADPEQPGVGSWRFVGPLATGRERHTATLLPSGKVLVAGGFNAVADPQTLAPAELFLPDDASPARRPDVEVDAPPLTLRYGEPVAIRGTRFFGDSEASSGRAASSAVNYPLVQLLALESGRLSWLLADELASFCRGNAGGVDGGFCDTAGTLTFSELPAIFDPGWYLLTVVTAGAASESRIVRFECSVAVTEDPEDQLEVPIGSPATFSARAQGARHFQWQSCLGDDEKCSDEVEDSDWVDIPGATGPSYTTAAIGPESGTRYRVLAGSDCSSLRDASRPATLTVNEDEPPFVEVTSPTGGEFWQLSDPSAASPNTEVITWSMRDNVRVCSVRVDLLVQEPGFEGFSSLCDPDCPDAWAPVTFGPGGACLPPGAVTTSLSYPLPERFEDLGVSPGSVFKVEVTAVDASDNSRSAVSPDPFFIVQANADSVQTLILSNTARMKDKGLFGVDSDPDPEVDSRDVPKAELEARLRELADHPRVLGRVIDLDAVPELGALYAGWTDPGDVAAANAVLFDPDDPDDEDDPFGIHAYLLNELIPVFTGAKYLVLAGDDRIIPMARLPDRTALLTESTYPQGSELTAATTVGAALAADQYLSDDPLGMLDPVTTADLLDGLFIPDLAVGRLVETPAEIQGTISTYISQDGILDLTTPENADHQVLVTGYDFLVDSALAIRERWQGKLGVGSPEPVDGVLVGSSWDLSLASSPQGELLQHLGGQVGDLGGTDGGRFGIMSLSGHATHFEAGVPAADRYTIAGLQTCALNDLTCPAEQPDLDAPLDLAGGVVYAVGCHSGLPVPGSDPDDDDHSLDLPQTFLSRGVQAYVGNTGYGFGFLHGIAYGERLVELFTEQLTGGGTIAVGDAVKATKQRYFQEAQTVDVYDLKSLMQWTLFGLPMYAVRTGIDERAPASTQLAAAAPSARELPAEERLGPVAVRRQLSGAAARGPAAAPAARGATLPEFLTRLDLHFDLSAAGVFSKRTASGDRCGVDVDCPQDGCDDPVGCYYTLNGLVERASGVVDEPLQPYLRFDSRLAGTSQHGVLWKGGVYREEGDWKPTYGQVVSNEPVGGEADEIGVLRPKSGSLRTTAARLVAGQDPADCQPTDTELNSLVINAGEAVGDAIDSAGRRVYDRQRIYREIDLEVFYFNDVDGEDVDGTPRNCDVRGPRIGPGPYHEVNGTTLEWAVKATDESGIWRVVVVYDDGQGRWTPLDLEEEACENGTPPGTFCGGVTVAGGSSIAYMLQAVDQRGNVEVLDFQVTDSNGIPCTCSSDLEPLDPCAAACPESGVPPQVPEVFAVEIPVLPIDTADLEISLTDSPDPVAANEPLNYTITVRNLPGHDPATSVEVVDTLPAGAALVFAGGAGWSCSESMGVVSCQRPILAAGESAPPITLSVSAPGSEGVITNTAKVEAFVIDPDPLNNERSEQTTVTVDAVGPRVAVVGSAEDTGDGALAECEDVKVAIRRILLIFSEAMRDPSGDGDPGDVTNPANYRLLAAGPDHDLQTAACGPPQGDDSDMAIDGVVYDGLGRTATLDLRNARGLADGLYRLIACAALRDAHGNALDGRASGGAASDFLLTFRVDRANLFSGGRFDCSLAGWVTASTVPEEIGHDPDDVDGAVASGSATVTNLSADRDYALGQCLPLSNTRRLTLSTRARLVTASHQALRLVRGCELFPVAGCLGEPLSGETAVTLLDGADAWEELTAEIEVPAAAVSALCSLEVSRSRNGDFRLFLDDAVLSGAIFTDGFESGDVSAWSPAAP